MLSPDDNCSFGDINITIGLVNKQVNQKNMVPHQFAFLCNIFQYILLYVYTKDKKDKIPKCISRIMIIYIDRGFL